MRLIPKGLTRSAFLAAGATATLLAAPRLGRAASPAVEVAYAGSLVHLMEDQIGPAFAATGYDYRGEGKGSTALANLIRGGLRTPDVFISADPVAIESLFGTAGHDNARWYAEFATTRIVIAYAPDSKHAADFTAAAAGKKTWYDVLQGPDVVVARTDPAQDPKGYRVLLVMQLAEAYYHEAGLAQRVLGDEQNPKQILPEEDAFTRLESGEVDAVWAYSTEAVSRKLPALELPPEINLGDPAMAARYATASVTVGTKTYHGAPAVYALTIPTHAANPAGGVAFAMYLLGPHGHDFLVHAGLGTPKPIVLGDRTAIPAALDDALELRA